MDPFWLSFKLGKPLMGFRGAPQPHCASHDPPVFHRTVFVDQLLDACKPRRSICPIDRHHAGAYLGPVQRSVPNCTAQTDP
jgi:hypothetical protein